MVGRWFTAVGVNLWYDAVTVATERDVDRQQCSAFSMMNAGGGTTTVDMAGPRKLVDLVEEASAAVAAHVVMFSSRTCAPRLRHHLATAEWMASLMSARAS